MLCWRQQCRWRTPLPVRGLLTALLLLLVVRASTARTLQQVDDPLAYPGTSAADQATQAQARPSYCLAMVCLCLVKACLTCFPPQGQTLPGSILL